jgi:predicted permease
MRWIDALVSPFRSLFRRNRVEQELDAELQFHLQQQIAENLAAGMASAEARSAAIGSLGGLTLIKEQCRDSLGLSWLDDVRRDVRYAARTLIKSPGFTAVATLTLAIGIGANTAFFTLVRSVLLKPLPFPDSDRLVMLYESSADGKYPYNIVAGGIFQEWQKGASSFEQMAIWGVSAYNLSGTQGQLPEKIDGAKCSWNLFSTLGVQPAYGRSFAPSDDSADASPTAILSWNLWQRRFAGDRSVVGAKILLDGEPWTVIGVMPSWFAYPDPEVQLWTPVRHETRPVVMNAFGDHQFRVVARLRSGATPAEGRSQIDAIVKRIHAEHLDDTVGNGANILPLLDEIVHDYKTPLYVLLAAAGCFLLIACLNAVSLVVARSAARRKELAIRSALGGSRARLLRQQLTESLLVCIVGGAAGIVLAWAALQWTAQSDWMLQLRHDIPRGETVHIDRVVLAFAAAITLLSGSVVGLLPAFGPSAGRRVLETLQESSRAHTTGQGRARLRKLLLSLEIGLTVVLLIAAGLLLKTYQRLRSSDIGCVTEHVLTMRVTPPKPEYDAQQRVAFFEALIERVRNLPGVQRAAMVSALPGDGYGGDNRFTIAEHPPLAKNQFQIALRRFADPGYFSAMQIPVLRGRTFNGQERLDRATSVIVSDLFARRFFPHEDPVGKHLRVNLGGRELAYQIVGVVGDTRFSITRPIEPMMYFPLYSGLFGSASITVSSAQDANNLALPIQKLVAQMDPDLPVSDVLTMEQLIGRSTLNARFHAGLVLAFAGLSLLLICVGLYGVLSYLVTQRRGEIGIRVALGAQRHDVLRLMLMDGLRSAAIGLALGLPGGVVATRLLESALYGVRPLDAGVFAAVVLLLSMVAGAASLLPAWRASRLDPAAALREE